MELRDPRRDPHLATASQPLAPHYILGKLLDASPVPRDLGFRVVTRQKLGEDRPHSNSLAGTMQMRKRLVQLDLTLLVQSTGDVYRRHILGFS